MIRPPSPRASSAGRPRVLAGVLAACTLGLGASATLAQRTPAPPKPASKQPEPEPAMADVRIQPMTRYEAEQARLRAQIEAAPPAYEDRFMDPAAVAEQDRAEAENTPPEPTGLRAWLFETRAGYGRADSTGLGRQSASEYGVRAEYRRETLNHGDFLFQYDGRALQGDLRAGWGGVGALGYATDRTSGRLTLRSIGLPLTPRLFADTTLGDMYSELTSGLSRHYRLSLGATTVRGIATRVFDADTDLRVGTGQRGLLTGGPYPGFEKTQGTLSWLGYTRRLGNQWYVAGQLDQANGIPAYYLDPLTAQGIGRKDVSSWAVSVGHGPELLRDGDLRLRATALGSRVRSRTPGVAGGIASGLFVEGSLRHGLYRHEFGAYAARPNLHFGDVALATGTRGAYWRVDRSASRLSWGLGLDLERAARDPNFSLVDYSRSGISGNVQYLQDRHTVLGGSFNAYQQRFEGQDPRATAFNGRSRSFFVNVFYQSRFFGLPRTRFSLTVRRNDLIVLGSEAATGQEVQWEQDWIGGRQDNLRTELTTTLGYARDRSSGETRHYPTAGVQFRYWPDSTLSLTGSLRYTSQQGDLHTSRGLSGTLSAEKELGAGWRLGLGASLNQARVAAVRTSYFGPQIYRGNDKGVYVYLRWEGRSGQPYAPMGARGADAGSGGIEGRVFFDANRDGIQQVGENGAPGIEVVLDGRYRAITADDGRFEFPLVTTGRHQLSLRPESVPLPWGSSSDDAQLSVDVPLRGRASTFIPVTKVAP